MSEWLEDGYPTDEALERIKSWDYKDGWRGLMDFIKPIWAYADWGWKAERAMDETHDRPVDAFYISTAGWSGNESIIGAMKDNWMFWAQCWVQSRRGGHYIFYLEPNVASTSTTASREGKE